MTQRPLTFDWGILKVFIRRYYWIVAAFTVLSLGAALLIGMNMTSLHTTSQTILLNQDEEVQQIVGMPGGLHNQLVPLRHILLNDDFIETHIIRELRLNLDDVQIPPLRLQFVPALLNHMKTFFNFSKRVLGREIYTMTPEVEQASRQRQVAKSIREQMTLKMSRDVLLTISYTGPNPQASQAIVKIAANECIEYLLGERRREIRQALLYIQDQYRTEENTLVDLENQLAKEKIHTITIGQEAQVALLQQRQDAVDQSRTLRQQAESVNDQKNALLHEKDMRRIELLQQSNILEMLTQANDPLAIELKRSEEELKTLLETYTPKWPPVKKLQQKIAALRQELDNAVTDPAAQEHVLLTDLSYSQYTVKIQHLEAEAAALALREANLQENIAFYEEQLKAMPELQKSLIRIQREIEHHSSLLIELAAQREKIVRAQDAQRQFPQARIIKTTGPELEGLPTYMVMILLFLLGPCAGSAIIGLLYSINTSVRNSDDVQQEFHLPVLAVIPGTNARRDRRRYMRNAHARRPRKLFQRRPAQLRIQHAGANTCVSVSLPEERATQPDLSAVTLCDTPIKRIPLSHLNPADGWVTLSAFSNPDSQSAEEYQRVCFHVKRKLTQTSVNACQTIMITSALPGEGKTTVACNLAATLAREHQVLFVDFNFRHPSFQRLFGIPADAGISDLLAHASEPSVFCLPGFPGLSLLPTGMTLVNPSSLLNSGRLESMMEAIKRSTYFDYVILDTPAIFPFPDASILASKVDTLLWVIQELQTGIDPIRSAFSQVDTGNISGVVLNKSEKPVSYTKFVDSAGIIQAMSPRTWSVSSGQ